LSITLNSKLNEITGFKKLQKSISLSIYDNPVLESINSFDSISSVKQNILILRNSKLRSLIGLNNLRTARNIEISNHDSLSTLDVLNNLANTEGDLIITNLKIISDRLAISRCRNLIDISELRNIDYTKLKILSVAENDSLSLCNVYPICKYLEENIGIYSIVNNKTGCNSPEEVLASCKTVNTYEDKDIHFSLYPNPTSGIINFGSNIEG